MGSLTVRMMRPHHPGSHTDVMSDEWEVPAPVPAAAQVGPGYAMALGQGAGSPVWRGGALRLRVKAKAAFPVTCCYQLELRAH